MRLVADSNLTLLDETFAHHGTIVRIEGREIRRHHLQDADVLLLRSVTRANADLLDGTPVRFIGTATIGIDHLDLAWMEQNAITWAAAPGCNADAAAQYTLASLWETCQRLGRDPYSQSVGIIGGGNVGSRLHRLLHTLGIPSVVCDPPLADLGQDGLVSYREALAQPVVSFHVPLTKNGPYPTWRMLDRESLASVPAQAIVINTSRGDVIDGAALLPQLQTERLHAALDVWPGEPELDPLLLASTTLATPHVAGYSVEGKQNGTLMIYGAFCKWLGEPGKFNPSRKNALSRICLNSPEYPVTQVLDCACGVAEDDHRMRAAFSSSPESFARSFDWLRKNYRLRHDFAAWEVSGAPDDAAATLRSLGFHIGHG